MATVAQFITSARYDLRDYQTGLEFDSEELLEYINRMKDVLDNTLCSMNSSYVHGTATLTLSTAANSIDLSANLNSGDYDTVRAVWIGSDEKEKISSDMMYYKRQFISDTREPDFWAMEGIYMIFDSTADADYSVEVSYNKTTPTLALTDNMPYADKFNQIFRELLVMHAKAKKEGGIAPAEQTYHAMFRAKAFADQIRQDYIPKRFKLDF